MAKSQYEHLYFKGNKICYGDTIPPADHPGSAGVTLELCAGIVDKTDDLKATAKAEVLEECGYDIRTDKLERVVSWPR